VVNSPALLTGTGEVRLLLRRDDAGNGQGRIRP